MQTSSELALRKLESGLRPGTGLRVLLLQHVGGSRDGAGLDPASSACGIPHARELSHHVISCLFGKPLTVQGDCLPILSASTAVLLQRVIQCSLSQAPALLCAFQHPFSSDLSPAHASSSHA